MLRLPPAASAELTAAFATDLPAAWRRARDRHPEQTPYAFVLHGHEGAERPRVWPVALTDEGLNHVAQQYVDRGHHDTPDEARDALRWSVPDAPDAYEWADGGLPTVTAAIERLIGTDVGDVAGYQMLADAAVPAWQALDAAGTFGAAADRDRLLIGFMLFDVAKDATLGTVALLNPPAVVERYRAQTEPAGFFQSATDLAVSADGRLIYTVGSTHDPAARPPGSENESTHELVAYAAEGATLDRRWAHRYQGFGDSLRAVRFDPTDGSLVVLRQRYGQGTATASLMRFAPDSPEPLATADLNGETNGRTLAVSPDGRWITVGVELATDESLVRVFDRRLAPAQEIAAASRVRATAWLSSGRLLVCTGHHLGVVDPATGDSVASVAAESDDVAIAADGSVVLSTRHPWRSTFERVRNTFPQVPTPVVVLLLPELTVAGTITLPGLILDAEAVSADGRTAIVEAHHIGSKRRSYVAIDVASGAELARRRPPLVGRPRFLPDGRTVAIGKSTDDGQPPVEFWTVRD